MTGDLNIIRNRLGSKRYNELIKSNSEFKTALDKNDREYEDVLIKALNEPEDGSRYKFWNLVDLQFPGEELVTIGEVLVDPKTGEEVPSETVLTDELDYFSI